MKVGRKNLTVRQEDSGKDCGQDGGEDSCRTSPGSDPHAPPITKSRALGTGVKPGFLDGQMLIAMPSMGDERFARTVIYMCAHSADGAMGIIVNQPAAHISFSDLLVQLEVLPAADL